jgi:hypothetical protein
MTIRLSTFPILGFVFTLAACGGGGDTMSIRGDFGAGGLVPTRVLAVEAEREAAVKDGAFELPELTAGPVTLRLLENEDTVGMIEVATLPGGTELELNGLRVDETTGRAFPSSVEGVRVATVNGIRVGDPARLPAEVDARGEVLAYAPESGALLLRPENDALPDLRVILPYGVETMTVDGDPVDATQLVAGDSVRVQGRSERGFVLASRLTVPRDVALADGGESADASSPGGGDDGGDGGDESSPGASASDGGGPSAPAVVASGPVRRGPDAEGVRQRLRDRAESARERGQGRGNARGRGGGKKPKN